MICYYTIAPTTKDDFIKVLDDNKPCIFFKEFIAHRNEYHFQVEHKSKEFLLSLFKHEIKL